MDQLIKMLQEKTGMSDEMAKQVADFIKEHMHELPAMLSGGDGEKGGAAGGLMDAAKGFLGGNKD